MLLIRCPWCGPREEPEFRYGGEAHRVMPSELVDDREWTRFLFHRHNPAGAFQERWVHVNGCRRWFNLIRDTTTSEILGTYLIDQRPEDAR